MPGLLPIEIVAALIALIPGLGTIYLARKLNALQDRQRRDSTQAAAANYKLALFHLRVEVYKAVQDYLSAFVMEGRPSIEAAVKLRHHARNARFLFPSSVRVFVEELSSKAFDYQRALTEATSTEATSTEAERGLLRDRLEMQAIEDWLTGVWETGRYLAEFEPFLTLPEALFQHDAAAAAAGAKSRDHATRARANESAGL